MEPKKEKVKWSQADDALLLHTLTLEKNKGCWGDNNPKDTTWMECVKKLAGSEKQAGGVAKKKDAIKSRWQKVCPLSYYSIHTIDKRAQLKQEYDVVKEIRGLSGFGWDPQLCTVTADSDVWAAYIKVSTFSCGIHTHAYMPTELESQ